MDDDDDQGGGGGGWIATFADLMSILMCFFVLLLSFSEMDVAKYKQIAGSMNQAFGVQNQVKVKDIPKGTSVIAQEFSPGRPNPTIENKVQQVTAEITRQSLDTRTGAPGRMEVSNPDSTDSQQAVDIVAKAIHDESAKLASELEEALARQIADGSIEVESGIGLVTIRIRERGSFTSGSALLDPNFLPIIDVLKAVLSDVQGAIAVEGHTDSIPINNAEFRSNWELSTGRALSVADALLDGEILEPRRFMVVGFADTRPRAPNDSWLNRAQNRRVEIVVRRGSANSIDVDVDSLSSLQGDGSDFPQ